MKKRKIKIPKRLKLMLFKNFIHMPRLFTTMLYYNENDKISEEKKYKFIRELGARGCPSGNIDIHGYGFDNLPKESYIMYPNHQGLFDVLGLVAVDPDPFGVVIKKETENIYGLRHLVNILGGLYMDRKDPKQGLKIINEVAEQVKAGRNFLIFPEGTRSKNGNVPGEFKNGSFKAAIKAKCPIVPIAIIDSYLPFDQPNTHKMDVQLHALPAIPYEEYKGMKTADIAEMVRSRIIEVIEANKNNFNNM